MRTSARQANTYFFLLYFQNPFLPCVIREWNRLDPNKRRRLSSTFWKALLNFTRPSEDLQHSWPIENKIFNIRDQVDVKLLTRLRLGFNHFDEHKFWHNFEDTLNHLCSDSIETETTFPFFCNASFSMISTKSSWMINEHWQISPISESRDANQCSVIWRSCFW